MSNGPDRYVPLLEAFVSAEMDAQEFHDLFLRRWKEDRDAGIATGTVIDSLMTGVDCFDAAGSDGPWRIDAEQLRAEAAEALAMLDH